MARLRGVQEADPDTQLFSLDGSDNLIFVIDRTGSMIDVINAMKDLLAQYVLRHVATNELVTENRMQLGLVTIDDHYLQPYRRCVWDGKSAHISYGLTDNLEQFMYWLFTIEQGNGSDYAEAYACGIQAAIKLDPKASIWVVGDSTPHGYYRSLRTTSNGESFPDGCPCGEVIPKPGLYNIKVLCTTHNATSPSIWQHEIGYPTFWVKDLKERLARDAPDTTNDDMYEPVTVRTEDEPDIVSDGYASSFKRSSKGWSSTFRRRLTGDFDRYLDKLTEVPPDPAPDTVPWDDGKPGGEITAYTVRKHAYGTERADVSMFSKPTPEDIERVRQIFNNEVVQKFTDNL